MAELADRARKARRKNIDAFRNGVVNGQVLELPNAKHYVIQSNQQEVLDAIEKFAASLAH